MSLTLGLNSRIVSLVEVTYRAVESVWRHRSQGA